MPSSSENIESPLLISPPVWEHSLSLGGSLILHLSMLGLLAAFILPGATSSRSPAIVSQFVDTVVEEVALIEPSAALLDNMDAPSAPDLNVETLLTDIANDQPELLAAAPVTDRTSPLELSETGFQTGGLAESVGMGKSSDNHGHGQGAGDGHGGTGTGKGGDGFFGLSIKGKRTVFVVDASRSMNMPHPGPTRTRFNRVKLELVRAVSSMTEKEQFFIMFFGDAAIPMPANQLVEADQSARKRYLRWVTQVQAIGQTYPQQALLLALRLQPDLIYFLTDGEFDFSVVPGVTKANVQGIPIHTIGFSDNRGESLLREIARLNNGTYTYIPPDESLDSSDHPGETAASIISLLGQ